MCYRIIKWFKTLRMKNQIIIIDTSIMLFVLGAVACCSYIEIMIFDLITRDSSEIVLDRIDQHQITIATYYVYRQVAYKHSQGILTLNHIGQFVQFDSKKQPPIEVFRSLEPSVTSDESQARPYLSSIYQFLYQENGVDDLVTLPANNRNITLLCSSFGLLNAFAYALNYSSADILQIVDFSPIEFDITFPTGVQFKEYHFQSRVWYLNHLEQSKVSPNELYFFSPIFQGIYGSTDYRFAITHSIFNEEQQLFAISKITITTNDRSFKLITYNVLLINYQGQVVYNGLEGFKNLTDSFYIYNESITGFNRTDWQQIEMHATLRTASQNQQEYSILSLYNKFHKTGVHVQSQKFVKENFTLIVFTNVSSSESFENQLKNIGKTNTFWLSISLMSIFVSGACFLMISVLIVSRICKPIVLIADQISNHVLSIGNNTNHELFKMFDRRKSTNNIFVNLNDKFINISEVLKGNQNSKSEICRLIERMKYNFKESTFDFTKVHQANVLIPDIEDCPDHVGFNLIKSSFESYLI